jgi:alpha-1,2-mannosyltransferase
LRGRLAIAGIIAFAVILGTYLTYVAIHPYYSTLDPVDLGVYRSGGLIVRHIRPWYNPHLAAPLYDWPGYENLHLKFTYPPFAAIVFAGVSLISWRVLPGLSVAVNIAALLAALWFTFGGLGYRRGLTRLGATMLTAAAVFWTEPVIRTLYLGQVNLILMALIIWDLGQPDTRRSGASRWWKGAGVGVAAPHLHPVPVADQEAPGGRGGLRGVRRHRGRGLRGRARRFGPVVAGRPVL